MTVEEKKWFIPNMTRRKFVQASAITTVATGAVLANPLGSAVKILADTKETPISPSANKVFTGVCRGNCAGGCFLNIEVRDGKVVRTSARDMPNTEYNRICVKGLSHVQRIYHKDRLKYPMKRVGERGEGKWERISWDEAIKTITDKWKGYEKEFGKNSFAIHWSSGSYGSVNGVGLGSPITRLANVTGNPYLMSSVDAAMGHSAGNAVGWGPNFTINEMADLKNAKTIFCWGANPVNSQQQNTHFFSEAKEKGANLVVIDPIFNGTAAIADQFVPIRPGSDGVLALAMMNIVIRENWIDLPFLKKSTVAPFLVKESDGKFLRQSDLGIVIAEGATDEPIVMNSLTNEPDAVSLVADPKINGTYTINGIKVTAAYDLLVARVQEMTVKRASELCNIPVDKIEELTKMYACNKPSTIYQFFGVDHYVNGHYSVFSIYALAMITGNMGKPGASCGMGENLGINFINMMGALYPEGCNPGISISALRLPEILETKMNGNTPIDLKGIYVTHANMLGNQIDRKVTLDIIKKIEFIAVADMNMNETAQYADILLPTAHWFEKDDIFCNYSTHPYLLVQEKAIEPLYECKSDFEIVKLLANKLGYGKFFEMDEFEYMKLLLDSDGSRALGITYDTLMDKKAMRCLPGEPYIFGEDGTFPTATGRAQFYVENPLPNVSYDQVYDADKERLPYFEPPHEAWFENPLYEKYPFSIIQDHTRYRTHTQWWDVPVLKELDPEPTVKLNSKDAKARGIKTGDQVKVYNDRGYVIIKAIINDGVQPGVLTMPKGWEKHEFIEGHYQDLTSRVSHNVCVNSAFFDLLVDIKKI